MFRSAEIRVHLAQVIHRRNLADPQDLHHPHCHPQEAYSDCSSLHLPARTSHLCSLCLSLPWHVPLSTCPSGHILPRELPSHVCLQKAFSSFSLTLNPTDPVLSSDPPKTPSPLQKRRHDRVGVRPGSIQWGNRKAEGASKDGNRHYPF